MESKFVVLIRHMSAETGKIISTEAFNATKAMVQGLGVIIFTPSGEMDLVKYMKGHEIQNVSKKRVSTFQIHKID
jgi:hypothetical protein